MKHIVLVLVVVGLGLDADAQSTGYPACDEFISMVNECIRTKMPESERADKQRQIEHFRELVSNPMFGAAVSQKCGENIRLEMQRDKYGCYAARAQAAGVRTACSLVTSQELQTILATAVGPGTPGNSKCNYESAGPPAHTVTIEVNWSDGPEHMKSWRTAVAKMQRRVGESTVPAETVSGVADDAFHVGMGFTPMLAVRKGDVALSVQALATREQLLAIARKALERLK
jgi:hypothetical protein